LLPVTAQEIGSYVWKQIPRVLGSEVAMMLGPLPANSELRSLLDASFRAFDPDLLEIALTDDRLLTIREKATTLFYLWEPGRAAREPVPPIMVVLLLMLDIIGISVGNALELILSIPDGSKAGKQIRRFALTGEMRGIPR
jgi:hypothetical protein